MNGTSTPPTRAKTLLEMADTRHVDALLEAADLLMEHSLLEKHAGGRSRGDGAEKSTRYVTHAIALQNLASALVEAGARPSAQVNR